MAFFKDDETQDQANVVHGKGGPGEPMSHRAMFPPAKDFTGFEPKKQLVERDPPPFSPATLFNDFNRSQLPKIEWRRLRIAMTQAELDAYRAWVFETKENFTNSIMGCPIVVEEHPVNPKFCLEYRE